MLVVICPDKFRGSATASELAFAARDAISNHFGDAVAVRSQPLADGGEGTLEALGGANRVTTVLDPLGRRVDAEWRLAHKVAVIEMARASGLVLVGGREHNDALEASTFGTGTLILEAAERGAERIIVAVGGSAGTDGGLGALRAMYPLERFRGLDVTVACDVETTFVESAAVFGPQKGATAAQVKLLKARLERLVVDYRDAYGVDIADIDRGGAAGGLAGGLAAGIGANLVGGFDVVADEVALDVLIDEADLVITGEGELDQTSFAGKVVGGVASFARAANVPTVAVCGSVCDDCVVPSDLDVVSLTDRFGLAASMAEVTQCFAAVCVSAVAAKLG